MNYQILLWGAFNVFIIAMLIVDLKVFHRHAHTVPIKEALIWTGIWIVLALLFNLGIYMVSGPDLAVKFLTGYLIEKSLSMDNLFVFLLIFAYFGVAPRYQHNILFWGILGALIMRALFIAAGVTLIERFHWIIYIFGVFLIYTGMRLFSQKNEDVNPGKNPVLRLARRFLPLTSDHADGKFFVRRGATLMATPLFVVLLVIETTDVIFALDSIPAILGITLDPFIVYSSNVFAILGLRALYFALAGVMRMFHYLHYGLSLILVFIGIKMLLSSFIHINSVVALGVVGAILILSIVASILWPPKIEEVLPEQTVPKQKQRLSDEQILP